MVNTNSSDSSSSDSSALLYHQQQHPGAAAVGGGFGRRGGNEQEMLDGVPAPAGELGGAVAAAGGEGGGLQLQPGELPPPKQLHAEYSHRLHQNQVAQGHHNFVVGGAHGRYRDYGGTLIEVPEEVFAVRQAALTVLEPITYCWVSSISSMVVCFLCSFLPTSMDAKVIVVRVCMCNRNCSPICPMPSLFLSLTPLHYSSFYLLKQ